MSWKRGSTVSILARRSCESNSTTPASLRLRVGGIRRVSVLGIKEKLVHLVSVKIGAAVDGHGVIGHIPGQKSVCDSEGEERSVEADTKAAKPGVGPRQQHFIAPTAISRGARQDAGMRNGQMLNDPVRNGNQNASAASELNTRFARTWAVKLAQAT